MNLQRSYQHLDLLPMRKKKIVPTNLRKARQHICPKHGLEDCGMENDENWQQFYYGKHSCPLPYPDGFFGNFTAKGIVPGKRN